MLLIYICILHKSLLNSVLLLMIKNRLLGVSIQFLDEI